MAIPPNAVKLGLAGVQMDPKDVLEWPIIFAGALEDGELVATYTLTPIDASNALGLTVAGGAYAPTWEGTNLIVWLQIDSSMWDDPSFSGAGVQLPIELYYETDATPARKRELTLYVEVAQQ